MISVCLGMPPERMPLLGTRETKRRAAVSTSTQTGANRAGLHHPAKASAIVTECAPPDVCTPSRQPYPRGRPRARRADAEEQHRRRKIARFRGAAAAPGDLEPVPSKSWRAPPFGLFAFARNGVLVL